MLTGNPIRQILLDAPDVWNHEGTRPCVREAFKKIIDCGTPILGWQIYASDSEICRVYHRCKSRFCPSCGYRATVDWQRDQWTQLPGGIPYSGLVFTMPGMLWPIFQQNRQLLHDLATLAAEAVLQWMKDKYSAVPLVLAVQHTFGRHLNFNAHIHMLVSSGGLEEFQSRWRAGISINPVGLMKLWRHGVITYLRLALQARILKSNLHNLDLLALFAQKYEVDWNVDLQPDISKRHFLGYAARYIRRPPIAQHRFREVSGALIKFVTKDTMTKETMLDEVPKEQFIRMLADQVPDKCRHSVRYYGLLAPRSRSRLFTVLYKSLGQERLPLPRRLSWAHLIQKSFGRNPLIDKNGQCMHFVGQHFPAA